MAPRVYNTLTREKTEFKPVEPGKVRMYVCGPTVYKPSHVGHMVGPVIFDTVKRYLSYLGYRVTLVVNVTDIDDKIIHEAREQNRDWRQLAQEVTADYVENLTRLNVTGIDHMPRATEYIDRMITIIGRLIEKGFAYPAGGDVYFDISKDTDYGKLCHRDPEQMEAGARIEVSDKKRNPGDFALWKGAKPGEPSWDSPWGPGRPGWHIECTAMSTRLLGDTMDIHGGGLDLQFPHHENELAQSESFTGKRFVNYWMHNGLMKTGDKKMAKSAGNEIVVTALLQRHRPETLRFLLLSTHYRSPIEYSEDRLHELRRALDGFSRFFERFERVVGVSFFALSVPTRLAALDLSGAQTELLADVSQLRNQFLECMDDDFNTGGAVGSLFEMLTTLNRFADARKLEEPGRSAGAVDDFRRAATVLRELSQILGLFTEAPAEECGDGDELVDGLMRLLLDLRKEARQAKNFALADQIRNRLGELGVTLEDRAGGTDWRRG
jgi:cysteinyl-tRNA synthetase